MEEALKMTLEKIERIEEQIDALLKRHEDLKSRSQRALARVKVAIALLEAADRSNPHIEAGLKKLYEVERLLTRALEAEEERAKGGGD
jgi:Asp-tRNA(Asn)/Glu-tRNA(Gln) amidotransferase A subunit family amidase